MLSWIGKVSDHWSGKDLLDLFLPYFVFAIFSVYFEISKPLRLVVLALLATGMVSEWPYVLLLFALCLMLGKYGLLLFIIYIEVPVISHGEYVRSIIDGLTRDFPE